jgi:hypothetical protein
MGVHPLYAERLGDPRGSEPLRVGWRWLLLVRNAPQERGLEQAHAKAGRGLRRRRPRFGLAGSIGVNFDGRRRAIRRRSRERIQTETERDERKDSEPIAQGASRAAFGSGGAALDPHEN